jgi:omega-6 fatty acid desaturase (delta-12 desaturase)
MTTFAKKELDYPTGFTQRDKTAWAALVAKYQTPNAWKSIGQACNTFIPFFLLWYLMYLSLDYSYWLTLALALPAAGLLVRIFIIQHDCGHGSFFKSNRLNDFWGILTGLLVFTPYYAWRHNHAVHHASVANLDKRGVGDVMTATVREYLAMPWYQKLWYRVFRHPLVMLTIGPLLIFLIVSRFPSQAGGSRERASVWWTNLALAGMVAGMSALIGLKAYVLIQLPVLALAASAGVWMFYVQHNFDGTYWVRHEQWDFYNAAIKGSSYYQLPRLLQWFSGNIGFHHIHHLSPRIPNYLLEKCHRENPPFQIRPLTLRRSLKSLFYRLWDEDRQVMVGFRAIRVNNRA